MASINWILWLVAASGGVIVGCIILAIGMVIEKRREDARISEELCEMAAEMDDEDGRG